MSDPTLPANFGDQWRDVLRRLSALERSPQLPNSSMRGGRLALLDDNGVVRWAAGNVTIDASVDDGSGTVAGGYGIAQFDEHGAATSVQISGFRGVAWPSTPFPMHDPTPKSVTSGSFAGQFEAREQNPVHDVLKVSFAVVTPSGTTGEVRLNTGTNATATLTIPSNTNGFAVFTWLHPAVCGLGDSRAGREPNLYVTLEARRTGGTGAVSVFPPQTCELVSSWLITEATTNGNPRLT